MKIYNYDVEAIRSHLPLFCEFYRTTQNPSDEKSVTADDVLLFTRDQLIRHQTDPNKFVEAYSSVEHETLARLISYKEFITTDEEFAEIDDFLPSKIDENLSDFYYWFLQYVEYEKINRLSNK